MPLPSFVLDTLDRALVTAGWVALVVIVYVAVVRLGIDRARRRRETRRRRLIVTRNLVVLVALVGLGAIWFEPLRELGTALAVVAGGLAIATKEFWLNIMGYLFHPVARSFGIGERIKIGDVRGDVIDQNMMGTTLLEVGPAPDQHQYTGRTVFVPNSLFLGSSVSNETFLGEFVFHLIRVPLRVEADWLSVERRLLEAARTVSAPYLERARRHIQRIEERHSLTAPTIEPHVRVSLPDSDTLVLMLRLPVPARKRSQVEQAILRRYLESGDEPAPDLSD